MSEQNEEITRVPATEKPHYWIYIRGSEFWNRWAAGNLSRTETDQIFNNIRNNCRPPYRMPEPYEIIDFSSCEWPENEDVKFNDFIFPSITIFDYSLISSTISFFYAIFEEQVSSQHATFENDAIFSLATFKNNVFFNDSKFYKSATFVTTQFHSMTTFNNSDFNYPLTLSSCTFHSTLNLENTKFSYVPDLRGSDIKRQFILPPKKLLSLTAQTEEHEIWAKLKYEMNRQHLHQEELDFFAKELECRALGGSLKEKLLITLYRTTADFGRSALMPLEWLIFSFLIFILLYKFAFFTADGSLTQSALLSLRSSLPLIPMGENLLNIPDGMTGLQKFALQLTRSVQFIISSVLIFLILLGIRNWLRIK